MKTIKTYLTLGIVILVLIVANVYFVWDSKNDPARTSHNNNVKEATTSPNDPSTVAGPDTSPKLKGCDISHWDGEIDWSLLKSSGLTFLFIKATQGADYTDPDFEYNWTTAKNYGFNRGAYHFYQPKDDPEAQAKHFLSVIKPEKGDILPVLDIEISDGVDPGQLSADIAIWVKTIREAIGRYPIIYTDKAFWDRAINKDFAHCPLWIAEWQTSHPPYLPTGWDNWIFWQYSESGTVKGIRNSGKVDMDWFNGDKQTLKNYQIR